MAEQSNGAPQTRPRMRSERSLTLKGRVRADSIVARSKCSTHRPDTYLQTASTISGFPLAVQRRIIHIRGMSDSYFHEPGSTPSRTAVAGNSGTWEIPDQTIVSLTGMRIITYSEAASRFWLAGLFAVGCWWRCDDSGRRHQIWRKPVRYATGNHEYYTQRPMNEEDQRFEQEFHMRMFGFEPGELLDGKPRVCS